MLYLAAQTLTKCPAYSYWFLATDAEEMGLDGAKAFLAAPPVPRAQLLLNINLDMTFSSNTTVGLSGGSQPLSIRDPYIVMNWIIALQGIYPSRN